MQSRQMIHITPRGPCLVTGGIPLVRLEVETDEHGYPLKWRFLGSYPQRETYSLCRCGASKNKPYCDGSHGKCSFKWEEVASRSPYLRNVREYKGPELLLTDRKDLCTGAGFCDRAGNIWNLTTHSDTPEFRAAAIEEAANCPSGRLVVWGNDGKIIEPHYEKEIAVTFDQEGIEGPLWIRGAIEIVSSDGYIYERRNRVTLCQCGRTDNSPFCDGSHLGTE